MIQFQQVEKRFTPALSALAAIDLEISKGEVVLLCGPSGAGKSTLLKLIYREEEPSAGAVLVAGHNLKTLNSQDVARLRQRIGLVFQESRLLADLTALENVALAAEVAGASKHAARARASQLLDELGLAARRDAEPAALSGGEQQRIAIARALVNRPNLILADEPTGNLDAAAAADTLRLFKEIQREDSTIVIASHDVDLFKDLATRVVRLDQGRIVADSAAGTSTPEWRL